MCVLNFKLRSIMQSMDQCSHFTYGYLIVLASFVEQFVLRPLNSLCSFNENQLTVYVWIYFCTLCSIDLFVYLNASAVLSSLLWLCNVLKSGRIVLWLYSSFPYWFGYSRPFTFPYELQAILSAMDMVRCSIYLSLL